jgi:serine/threonine-protein kinase
MIKRFFEYIKKCNNIISLTIGEFELQSTLGQGGNGIVYSGKILGKNIALKFLISDSTGNTLQTKTMRFLAEYFNVVTIENSEGIVKYIDYDTLKFSDSDGDVIIPVILMKEYKSSLSNISPVNTKEDFLNIFNFLLDTVEKIHNCGIIHRDLKPENILLTLTLEPKIADFGFSKNEFDMGGSKTTKPWLGTRPYMAPELLAGRLYNPAECDIFAAGHILYIL